MAVGEQLLQVPYQILIVLISIDGMIHDISASYGMVHALCKQLVSIANISRTTLVAYHGDMMAVTYTKLLYLK